MSTHSVEDKTKFMLSSTKNIVGTNVETLVINYGDIKIEQYFKVTYLGCELEKNL